MKHANVNQPGVDDKYKNRIKSIDGKKKQYYSKQRLLKFKIGKGNIKFNFGKFNRNIKKALRKKVTTSAVIDSVPHVNVNIINDMLTYKDIPDITGTCAIYCARCKKTLAPNSMCHRTLALDATTRKIMPIILCKYCARLMSCCGRI